MGQGFYTLVRLVTTVKFDRGQVIHTLMSNMVKVDFDGCVKGDGESDIMEFDITRKGKLL